MIKRTPIRTLLFFVISFLTAAKLPCSAHPIRCSPSTIAAASLSYPLLIEPQAIANSTQGREVLFYLALLLLLLLGILRNNAPNHFFATQGVENIFKTIAHLTESDFERHKLYNRFIVLFSFFIFCLSVKLYNPFSLHSLKETMLFISLFVALITYGYLGLTLFQYTFSANQQYIYIKWIFIVFMQFVGVFCVLFLTISLLPQFAFSNTLSKAFRIGITALFVLKLLAVVGYFLQQRARHSYSVWFYLLLFEIIPFLFLNKFLS